MFCGQNLVSDGSADGSISSIGTSRILWCLFPGWSSCCIGNSCNLLLLYRPRESSLRGDRRHRPASQHPPPPSSPAIVYRPCWPASRVHPSPASFNAIQVHVPAQTARSARLTANCPVLVRWRWPPRLKEAHASMRDLTAVSISPRQLSFPAPEVACCQPVSARRSRKILPEHDPVVGGTRYAPHSGLFRRLCTVFRHSGSNLGRLFVNEAQLGAARCQRSSSKFSGSSDRRRSAYPAPDHASCCPLNEASS